MATKRQIDANRRNARKSTGPRTQEGKNRARWNSLEHGLASLHTVLPHEDGLEYHRIRAELIESWQPVNAQELLLVDQIAAGNWRMLRSQRFENALFDAQIRAAKRQHGLNDAPHPTDDTAVAVCISNDDNQLGYDTLFRYDSRAQATYYRALDRLQKLQSDRQRRAARDRRFETVGSSSKHSTSSELASFGQEDPRDPAGPSGAAQPATPEAEPEPVIGNVRKEVPRLSPRPRREPGPRLLRFHLRRRQGAAARIRLAIPHRT